MNIGGRIDRGSLSLTEATGRGSAGGVPEVHPLPGRPPCRECWGVDRSRRRSPRQRPRDEVQGEEDQRRILPEDDRRAVNIGGRIAGGALSSTSFVQNHKIIQSKPFDLRISPTL